MIRKCNPYLGEDWMKRVELEKKLRRSGCYLKREGASHSLWNILHAVMADTFYGFQSKNRVIQNEVTLRSFINKFWLPQENGLQRRRLVRPKAFVVKEVKVFFR